MPSTPVGRAGPGSFQGHRAILQGLKNFRPCGEQFSGVPGKWGRFAWVRDSYGTELWEGKRCPHARSATGGRQGTDPPAGGLAYLLKVSGFG